MNMDGCCWNPFRKPTGRVALAFQAFPQMDARAYEQVFGHGGEVFNLSQKRNELRARYGGGTSPQSCQAARP
jgi:hypothetical protein